MRTLITGLLVAIGMAPAVAAAQSVALTPSVVILKGTSGHSATQRLTITNGASVDLAFTMEAFDVVVKDGRRVFSGPGELAGSIAATAVFSVPSIVVAAGAKAAVDVTITVPNNTAVRAMVALFKGTTKLAYGPRTATASLGTLLTFTLSDRLSMKPGELIVRPQSPTTNAVFELPLENDGSEPIVPHGVAAVLDATGRLVARSGFAEKRLLPGERLIFRSEYPGELEPGSYRVLATFEWGGISVSRQTSLVIP